MMNCGWLTCLALNLLLWGDAGHALSKAARYGWTEKLYTWDTVYVSGGFKERSVYMLSPAATIQLIQNLFNES